MKLLIKFVAVAGLMALTSACSNTGPALGVSGAGVCNNPKCQCPKPCQCGAGCKCGMNGNSTQLSK